MPSLEKKVAAYIREKYEFTKGFDLTSLTQQLPAHLQSDIMVILVLPTDTSRSLLLMSFMQQWHINAELVRAVEIFKDCSEQFLRVPYSIL